MDEELVGDEVGASCFPELRLAEGLADFGDGDRVGHKLVTLVAAADVVSHITDLVLVGNFEAGDPSVNLREVVGLILRLEEAFSGGRVRNGGTRGFRAAVARDGMKDLESLFGGSLCLESIGALFGDEVFPLVSLGAIDAVVKMMIK